MSSNKSFLKKSLHSKFFCDISVYTRCAPDPKEIMKNLDNSILFGKYQIISCLGTGEFSSVYLSKHTILEAYRAVKLLPKTSQSTVSLLTEAKLLKSLHHPGIPKIYDIYEDNDYYYLIEEYTKGEPLDEFLLHQSHISQHTFIDLCLQLCGIFQYLHSLQPSPILYLDLKPEHIIVCGMHIKLLDFNVANYVSNLGNIYSLFGNEKFSAPELCTGSTPNFSSDIYSIGKIMQYLSHYVEPSISPKFHKIIKKATDIEVSGRFETVDQLISAITKAKTKNGQSHSRMKIAVMGCHPGCGTTHLAISLVSTLNYMGYTTIYYEKNLSNSLRNLQPYLLHMHEENGMLCYRFFKGYPHYGDGILLHNTEDSISVYDYGDSIPDTNEAAFDFVFFVCSNSLWHLQQIHSRGEELLFLGDSLKIICNMGQPAFVHGLAKHFSFPIYHYSYDENAFCITGKKINLVSQLLSLKRRKRLFFHFDLKELLHRS